MTAITPTPMTKYLEFLRSFIKGTEGFSDRIYIDGKGVPTIGYGLALAVKGATTWAISPALAHLPRALSQIESGELDAAIANLNTYGLSTDTKTKNDAATTNLQKYKISEVEGTHMLDAEISDAETEVKRILKTNGLSNSDLNLLANSKEFAAMVDMKFNGVFGTNTAKAYVDGDRAKLWYETRYGNASATNNGTNDRGLQKRRYWDAELFEFSAANSTLTQAMDAYTVLTENRATIYKSEALHGVTPDGLRGTAVSGGITAFELSKNANEVGPKIGLNPKTLVESYQVHFRSIVDWANGFHSAEAPDIGGNISNSASVYFTNTQSGKTLDARVDDGKTGQSLSNSLLIGSSGEDILYGGSGDDYLIGGWSSDVLDGGSGGDILDGGSENDTLIGGTGHDVLVGGTGNDTLYGNEGAGGDILDGGIGNDTYYADEGDTIRDADGVGTIIVNGKTLSIAERKKGETAYRDAAGNIFIQNGGTLLVGDPLVIEKFSDGDFGIELKEILDQDDPDYPVFRKYFIQAESATSPIVLDLDANGLTTRGIGEGAFFDYDGNGFAERTGWINAQDGLLVRDLNGDGRISTGAELFGNNTKLKSGLLADSGFAAMADLDSNHDGMLDGLDTVWGTLKIWRDINCDGISQAGEIKTMAEMQVKSISTGSAGAREVSVVDSHGNVHCRSGSSFTLANGNSKQIEDIWFVVNLSSTRLDNPMDISHEIRALPEIKGMGNIASLWQVMAQEAASGAHAIKDLVIQFSLESNAETRHALAIEIIYAWTGVQGKDPNIYIAPFGPIYFPGSRKIYAMEALLGKKYEGVDPQSAQAQIQVSKSFEVLADSISTQLLQQTRLADLYGAIRYTWNESSQSIQTDLSGTLPLISKKLAANYELGRADAVDFVTCLGHTNNVSDIDSAVFMTALASMDCDVSSVLPEAWHRPVLTSGGDIYAGSIFNDTISGLGGDDVIQGGDGNDHLFGDAGDDRLVGQDGCDTLAGGIGNDFLAGDADGDTYVFNLGDGRDTIFEQGWSGTDTLRFGLGIAANDLELRRQSTVLILSIKSTTDQITIQGWSNGESFHIERVEFADGMVWEGSAWKTLVAAVPVVGTDGDDDLQGDGGNNTLIGGKGNDHLYGLEGNDTYVFNLGDGQDTVGETDYTPGKVDTLRFGSGIAASNIELQRKGKDLILNIKGTTSQITVQGWGDGEIHRIDRVEFADGIVWDGAAWKTRAAAVPIVGTDGDDVVPGDEGANTLVGGKGNDYLWGKTGNDTYVFNLGDGQDTIAESGWDGVDTLRFGAGIVAGDLELQRKGNDLIVNIKGTTDQITVWYWGNGDYYRVERVEFADGMVWEGATWKAIVAALPIVGTDGDDFVQGDDGNNTLVGDKGNDSLLGQAGNDTLLGGTGNDALYGGADDDLLDGGDGEDTLNGDGGVDRLMGGAGNDTLYGGAGDDQIVGGGGDDMLNGDEGADRLTGGAGNDTLYGGAGDDVLIGESMSDSLFGAEGNDTILGSGQMNGGTGNDIYNVNLSIGIGNLAIITDDDGTVGNNDQLDLSASPYQLLFQHVGNDLKVTKLNGSSLVVKDWYLGASHHVETLVGRGQDAGYWLTYYEGSLLDSKVQALVDAMAGFQAAPGQTEFNTPAMRTAINQAWNITVTSYPD